MTAMPQTTEAPKPAERPLAGLRVLVVEDDTFIFLDLETTLTSAGASVVGPCRSVEEALVRLAGESFDVAILDIRLGRDETAAPVAKSLDALGKPFLFYTGQAENDPALLPWPDRRIVGKPAPPATLIAAVRAVATGR